MDKINFTQQDTFPFTIKSADFMQNTMQLLSKMIALGGDNYVLSGCEEDNDNNVADGYVVIAGELMPFKGALKTDKITVVEDRETVSAFGVDYTDAYVSRYATFSDTGDLNWSDFQRIISNQELWQRVKDIKGDPPGIRAGWCGFIDKIPENYMLCDGRTLDIDEYPELFENIGTSFGAVGTTQFKIPDLRERFIVGYSGNGDYNIIGQTGGLDEVILNKSQMPEHDHIEDALFNKLGVRASDLNASGTTSGVDSGAPTSEYRIAGMTNQLWSRSTMKSEGGNQPHENRPPYFVEAFIIKVKY
jgi:microcystin-dependent protein